MITKVFTSRTDLRLKNKKNNFKFSASGEGKPILLQLLFICHKRGASNELRGSNEHRIYGEEIVGL